ncbi:unnamed protein product, partial [Prorocentrum cordatum]
MSLWMFEDGVAWWSELKPGLTGGVQYLGDAMDHERWLLHPCTRKKDVWIIATPDLDELPGAGSAGVGEDIAETHPRPDNGSEPSRPERKLYQFRSYPGRKEFGGMIKWGYRAAATYDPGSEVAPPAPDDVPLPTDEMMPFSELFPRWPASALRARGKRPSDGSLRDALGLDADGAAAPRDVYPASDNRTLGGDYDNWRERFKGWHGLTRDSTQETFSHRPLESPGIALSLAKLFDLRGCDPRQWPLVWFRERKLDGLDRTCHEMRVLHVLYFAGVYDRLRALEPSHRTGPRATWEHAAPRMGTGALEDPVSPALQSYAARLAEDRADMAAALGQGGARGLRDVPAAAAEAADAGDAAAGARGPAASTRSAKKAWGRARRRAKMVLEAVHGLNWLAGYDAWGPSQEPASPGVLTPEVMARVEGLVKDWGPMPEALLGRGALRDLLRGQSLCELDTGPANLAAFDADLVSLPNYVSGPPPIESLLDAEVSRYLEAHHELMLRPVTDLESIESETREIAPYTDRKLLYSEKAYRGFVRRLWDLGMLDAALRSMERIGVFFVWKSNKTRLRLIIGVRLCTSEAFANVEVGDGVFAGLERVRLYLGMADVKDCFRRLQAPAWHRPYFAWAEVPARVLGLRELDGVQLKPTDAAWPTSASMCMGFAWSLYFAQKTSGRLAAAAPSLRGSALLRDRSPPLVLAEGRPRHCVYVDNLGAYARGRGLAQNAAREWEASFADHGLELHGGEVVSRGIRALGCRLGGQRLRAATAPERFLKVWAASEEILRRGKCAVRLKAFSAAASPDSTPDSCSVSTSAPGCAEAEAPASLGAPFERQSWGQGSRADDAETVFPDVGPAKRLGAPAADDGAGPAGHLGAALGIEKEGLSLLGGKTVTANVRRYYSSHLQDFETSAEGLGPTLPGDGDGDDWLVKFVRASFLSGGQPDYGGKGPSAFADRHPAFIRAGMRRLPRAWRCLRGWRRLAPGRSGRPLPQAVWKAIAADLCLRGRKLTAAAAPLGVWAYLRPRRFGPITCPPPPLAREISRRWSPIIYPKGMGVAADRGAMGGSVVLGSRWQLELTPLWSPLTGVPSDGPVWAFARPALVRKFKGACSQLGVSAVPCLVRHSSPSVDRDLQLRPRDEVCERGRWARRKSVVRCGGAATLSKAWHCLPLATRASCGALDARLEELPLRSASRVAGHAERCLDQLDVKNLRCVEAVVRWVMQIAMVVQRSPRRPDFSGTEGVIAGSTRVLMVIGSCFAISDQDLFFDLARGAGLRAFQEPAAVVGLGLHAANGAELRTWAGHAVAPPWLRPCLLSVLQEVYHFIGDGARRRAVFPKLVRGELRVAAIACFGAPAPAYADAGRLERPPLARTLAASEVDAGACAAAYLDQLSVVTDGIGSALEEDDAKFADAAVRAGGPAGAWWALGRASSSSVKSATLRASRDGRRVGLLGVGLRVAAPFEIERGAECDLAQGKTQLLVLSEIRSGKIWAVHLGVYGVLSGRLFSQAAVVLPGVMFQALTWQRMSVSAATLKLRRSAVGAIAEWRREEADLHSRPSETLELAEADVLRSQPAAGRAFAGRWAVVFAVAESGRRTKTGRVNDAVDVGARGREWARDLATALTDSVLPDERVFDFDHATDEREVIARDAVQQEQQGQHPHSPSLDEIAKMFWKEVQPLRNAISSLERRLTDMSGLIETRFDEAEEHIEDISIRLTNLENHQNAEFEDTTARVAAHRVLMLILPEQECH